MKKGKIRKQGKGRICKNGERVHSLAMQDWSKKRQGKEKVNAEVPIQLTPSLGF